jgi:hypothetical protein
MSDDITVKTKPRNKTKTEAKEDPNVTYLKSVCEKLHLPTTGSSVYYLQERIKQYFRKTASETRKKALKPIVAKKGNDEKDLE